jgi:hypothetical protein
MPLPIIPANLLNTMVQTAMNNNAGIGIKAPQQLPQIPMQSAGNKPPTQSAPMPQIPMLSAKNPSMLPKVAAGAKITKYTKPQPDFGLSKFTNLTFDDILKPAVSAGDLLDTSFGFQFAPPTQSEEPKSFIEQQFLNLQTSLTENNKQLVGANEDLAKASQKVQDILASDDVEKSIQEYNNFVKDASQRPKFELATPRDYFYDKMPGGKERLSNRGLATIIISAIGSIFAPAQFRAENANAPTRLGSQFADTENRVRQIDYQNKLQAYNDTLQNFKNNISLAEQKNKRETGVAQFSYNQALNKVRTIQNLSASEQKQLTDLSIKVQELNQKGSDAERKTMIGAGISQYKSDDPSQRAAGYVILNGLGINVPLPTTSTLGQKNKETDIKLKEEKIAGEKQNRQLKTNKDLRDEAILVLKTRQVDINEKNINDTIRNRKFMQGIATQRVGIAGKNAANYQSLTKESKWNADFLKNQYNEINTNISKAEADLAKKQQSLNFANNSTDPEIKAFADSLKAEVDNLNTKIKSFKTQKTQILGDIQKLKVFDKTGGLLETPGETDPNSYQPLPPTPLTYTSKYNGIFSPDYKPNK